MRKISKIIVCFILIVVNVIALCPAVTSFAKNENDVEAIIDMAISANDSCIIYTKDSADISVYTVGSSEDTICEWGSASSILVWLSIMKLYEEGKVDLETDITQYLDADFNASVSFAYPITLMNLMNQTAGFQQNIYETVLSGTQRCTCATIKDLLISYAPKQIYYPGSVVAFSDYGITLAAYVVECVSGMDYAQYVKENIFDVLSINSTAVKADYSDCETVKEAVLNGNCIKNASAVNTNVSLVYSPFYPAYMTTGAASDLNILVSDICGSSSKILKAETMKEFFTPSLLYTDSELIRNSHGLFGYIFKKNVLGVEANGLNYNSCDIYIDPENLDYLILFSADGNTTNLRDEFVKSLYGDLREGAKSDDIASYRGVYLSSDTITKGKQSYYTLLSTISLLKSDGTSLYNGSNSKPIFTSVGNKLLAMDDMLGGMSYIRKDMSKVIELPHMEFMEFSIVSYYIQRILLVVMITGYFYASLLLIISLLRFIYFKITKVEAKAPTFRKYNYIQCANITLFMLFFLCMFVMGMMYAPYSSVNSCSFMFWIGTLMSVIYFAFYIKTGKNEKCSKLEKILYISTLVFSISEVLFAICFRLIM